MMPAHPTGGWKVGMNCEEWFSIMEAYEDADTLIVGTVLKMANQTKERMIIVSEDAALLELMMGRRIWQWIPFRQAF